MSNNKIIVNVKVRWLFLYFFCASLKFALAVVKIINPKFKPNLVYIKYWLKKSVKLKYVYPANNIF